MPPAHTLMSHFTSTLLFTSALFIFFCFNSPHLCSGEIDRGVEEDRQRHWCPKKGRCLEIIPMPKSARLEVFYSLKWGYFPRGIRFSALRGFACMYMLLLCIGMCHEWGASTLERSISLYPHLYRKNVLHVLWHVFLLLSVGCEDRRGEGDDREPPM